MMRSFLLSILLFSSGFLEIRAATLDLKSGYVRYEVKLKTLGIGGDVVTAVNKGVLGKITVSDDGRIQGGLVIPVVKFDSNNTKRDKDVANILKYKEYPAITFEVVEMSAEDVARALDSDSGRVNLKAKISAAGGAKTYDAVLDFRRVDSHSIRLAMRIDAKFSDFGIKPPRLGLILKTAPDKIDLIGDLVFEIEREDETQP